MALEEGLFAHKTHLAFDENYPCGRTLANVRGRIVKGKNVIPHSQPWMVTVSESKFNPTSDSEQGSYGCGGALISRRHILSAAHCAKICEKGSKTCDDKPVNWATLADHDKRKRDGELYVPIIKPYHVHPKAKQLQKPYGAFIYDYVIFVMECCVTYNSYTQPICFPKEQHSNLRRKKVLVSGWGRTAYKGSPSPILKSAEIEIIDDQQCKIFIPGGTTPYKKEYLFCAGDIENWEEDSTQTRDVCQNDSGGRNSISFIQQFVSIIHLLI